MFKKLQAQIKELPIFSHPLYLRYSNFVVPIVVLIIGLVIVGLITVPQIFKLFETFQKINELSEKKAFLENKIDTLSGINLDLYRKNLDTALVALPVDEDVPGVLGEVLVALSGSGMTLDGISFAGTSAPQGGEVGEYSLRMDISGSEDALKQFLERTKEIPRIVKMVGIEVTAKQGKMSAGVNLVTIYQRLPEHIGTVDEPVPTITEDDNKVLAEIEAKAKALPQNISTTNVSGSGQGKTNPFAP